MYFIDFRYLRDTTDTNHTKSDYCNLEGTPDRWICKKRWFGKFLNAMAAPMQTMAVDQQKILKMRYFRKNDPNSMEVNFRESYLIYL